MLVILNEADRFDPPRDVLDARDRCSDADGVDFGRRESNLSGVAGFLALVDGHQIHPHRRSEGWIEGLRVRAVGDRVSEGDLLFDLYAPEITISSADLLRGVKSGDRRDIEVAERQLRNFGVSTTQIEEMKEAQEPAQHIRVYAPQDGVVIAMAGADGMYLKPETRAMTLADLSTVWLVVDVFERDIARLSKDMTAIARFEHLSGDAFEGTIDYIYPELDATTRTLPVRLRFDNREGLLRPNMFGAVSLVPSESREAITVPSEAIIRTGRAERVILKTDDGVFRPRLVTTGLRDSFGVGGRTEIVQGLEPGVEVVASAQFLIDSETTLNAGLLRFAPTEKEPATGKGVLVSLDRKRRQAEIQHEPILALDWPALTTTFALRADVLFDRLEIGDVVRFSAARGSDGLLALTELKPDDGVDAVGMAVIHGVTADGMLSLSHDPIPVLGWPAMTMDLPVDGFDPMGAPLEQSVEIALAKGEDGLFTVVDIRSPDAGDVDMKKEATAEVSSAPAILVDGVIEAIDAAARTATVAHGPIAEIGMPGMTMEFEVVRALDIETLPIGAKAMLTLERPDGLTMVLADVEIADPPIKVMGTVNSVDAAARTANVTHGPIMEIGMPGMTMEFAVAETVDPGELPIGEEIALLLEKGVDFSLTLVGVGESEGETQ